MRRGEIWWVNFDPSIGGETRKKRPAIIISNDSSNRYLNRLQVVPTTSNLSRLYPSEALVTVAGDRSKAMADQVTTVSKARLLERIGLLDGPELLAVEQAVKLQLGLVDGKK